MADATRTVDIIFRGTNEITPAVNAVEEQITSIGTSSAKAASDVNASTDKINESFKGTKVGTDATVKGVDGVIEKTLELEGSPVAAIDKYGKAFVALGAVVAGALLGQFVAINSKVESFTKAIDFATGSVGDGVKEFDYLVTASNKLGVSVLSTTDGYKKLFLATSESNISTIQIRTLFEAITGSIAASGEDASVATGILERLADALGDNKITFTELNSIVKDLPGGLKGFADAIDVPVESLEELAKKGKIGVAELIKFADVLNGKVASADSNSLSTASNRLKTAIVELNVELARTGGFDILIDGVKIATDSVEGLVTVVNFVRDNVQFLPQIFIPKTFFEAYKAAGTAVFEFGEEVLRSQGYLAPAKTELELFAGAINAVNDIEFKVPDNNLGSFGVLANQANDTILVLRDSVNLLKKDNGDLWKLEPLEKFNDTLEQTQEDISKTELELEKLASNERIKNIEFKAKLEIAEVEANAKKVVAAFESISVGIKSTGELLASLFGDLNDAESISKRFAIEDQIALENERRQKELDLQKKLTEATIREINARTARLKAGDAVVTINGDGLQPHLEAFMWEILESIQVRVNADGLDMLLGVA